jgi:hypothetical protein
MDSHLFRGIMMLVGIALLVAIVMYYSSSNDNIYYLLIPVGALYLWSIFKTEKKHE